MIGIIGGYGDIGFQVAQILKKELNERLRIGGRNADKIFPNIKQPFFDDEWMKVDIRDMDSIKEFIGGCKIVVNCTGSSYRRTLKLAKAAVSYGCQYVDVGFDKEFRLLNTYLQNGNVIYATGSMPGLSGVLPRYLAEKFDLVKNMEFYYAGLGVFTPTAAEDYLEGLFSKDNKTMMIVKNGKIIPYSTDESINHKNLLSKKERKLFPYFDEESQFIRKTLNLKNGKWFIAIDGECTLNVLEKARFNYDKNKEETIRELCTATCADCQGRNTYVEFIVQIEGKINGENQSRTLILKYDNPSRLTGLVAASVVIALSQNKLSKGVYSLGACKEINDLMEIMRSVHNPIQFQLFKGKYSELFEEVEGEI